MHDEIRDALVSACGVEPIGVVRTDHGNRVLGEMTTLDADRIVRVSRLRNRILAFLRELPDDMLVSELRDELEW